NRAVLPIRGLAPQGHRLQRLLPPGLELEAALELQGPAPQVHDLEVEARDFQHEVVEEVRVRGVDVLLPGEGGYHRRRVPEELLDRAQGATDRLQHAAGGAAAAAIDGRRLELRVPARRLLEQLGQKTALEVVRLQDRTQRTRRHLADLLVREEARLLLLLDGLADLAQDPIDV